MPQLSLHPSSRSRRWLFFALAGALVLLLHGLLLVMLAPSGIDPEAAPAAATTLSVRSVTLSAPPPTAVVMPAAPPTRQPARQPASAAPAPQVARMPRPIDPAQVPPAAVAVAAAAAPVEPVAAPVELPAATAFEVPVYPTRLPAASTWHYGLTRGVASGQAQLSWQPDEQQGYRMQLEGVIAGITVLDWVSSGAIDDAGIAPDRFAIRRGGKDRQAANFQRDAGKITFSGPTHEVPLVAGVQDRLSWMLQLAAVIEAAPQRFGPGQRVALMVIGARGGADVWTFDVIGAQRVGD